jgi:hypothetical protein
MTEDDFDFDQPVTRIPQNAQGKKQLGNQILKQAEQSLEIRRKVYKSTSSKIVDSVNQCNEINKLIKKEKQNE